MANTVIGFFDNISEAQTAVQRLQEGGISRDQIDLSSGITDTGASNTSTDKNNREQESGVTRFFKKLFGNDDADRYTKVAQRSNAMVTVHAQSLAQAESIADILDNAGAIDVDERAAQYGYTAKSGAGTLSEDTNVKQRSTGRLGSETSIPRTEEDVQVGKSTVETGGIRVRSRIVEQPVEESNHLREEHIRIERTPVNRLIAVNALSTFKEGDIELTERAEIPVVNKEARVVEEVRVSKEVEERDETVRDTVRNTEIEIENLSNRKDTKNYDSDTTTTLF